MKMTMAFILMCQISLVGCKHQPVKLDPQSKALIAARDLYIEAQPRENIDDVTTTICRGDSLGRRIDRCGRHSEPGDYDSCIKSELRRGVCP